MRTLQSARPKLPQRVQKRARRRPEDARALILGAAEQVFAAEGPGATTLKAVARKAGVSHALVTHYFGTLDRLVEEILERHMTTLRETVLHAVQPTTSTQAPASLDALVALVFATLSDPLQARLMAWTFLSGRHRGRGFFARKTFGPRRIIDFLAGLHPGVAREELEWRVLLLWCAAVGYGAGASVLWEGLGAQRTLERDAAFLTFVTSRLKLPAPDAPSDFGEPVSPAQERPKT